MAITFPTTLDVLTNPAVDDTLDSPSHAAQHSNENDAVEAIEAKIGVDSSTVTTSLDYWLRTGWISADETWAYASATTITIPAGGVAKYAKGDKIKLTQTTVKYFYVVTVADELLTIVENDDYTLVDAAITLPFYSHAANPVGFPDTFAWTPAIVYGGGTTDPTSLTVNLARFKISPTMLTFTIKSTLVIGSGDRNYINHSLPVAVSTEQAAFGYSTCLTTGGAVVPTKIATTDRVVIFEVMTQSGVYEMAGTYHF